MPTVLDERPGASTRPAAEPSPVPAHEVVVRVIGDHGGSGRPPRRMSMVKGGGIMVGLVAIAVAVVVLANSIGGLLHFSLFGTNTVDRSAPVVLKEVRDVARYTAATGEYSATIDIEHDVSLLPSFIAGDRTIFTAVGTVDATVDFSRLSSDAVTVGSDGVVTIALPAPQIGRAVVDPARSQVASRQRGLVNRVAGVFSDSPTSERALYLKARQRLQAAAAKGNTLQVRAQRNTEAMLRGLLGRLGFAKVNVVFAGVPGTTPAPATTQ